MVSPVWAGPGAGPESQPVRTQLVGPTPSVPPKSRVTVAVSSNEPAPTSPTLAFPPTVPLVVKTFPVFTEASVKVIAEPVPIVAPPPDVFAAVVVPLMVAETPGFTETITLVLPSPVSGLVWLFATNFPTSPLWKFPLSVLEPEL